MRWRETATVFLAPIAVIGMIAYGLSRVPAHSGASGIPAHATAVPAAERIPPMPVIPHAFSVVPKGGEASNAERLKAARDVIAGWKAWSAHPVWDHPPDYSDWANARVNLTGIKAGADEFAEARSLAAELDRIGPDLAAAELKVADLIRAREQKKEQSALLNDVAGRKAYAQTLENNFLRNGMDATVRTEAVKGTTLRVKYIGFSRPLMFKLQEEGKLIPDIMTAARAHGFRKLIMEDGFRYVWTWDLTKS